MSLVTSNTVIVENAALIIVTINFLKKIFKFQRENTLFPQYYYILSPKKYTSHSLLNINKHIRETDNNESSPHGVKR